MGSGCSVAPWFGCFHRGNAGTLRKTSLSSTPVCSSDGKFGFLRRLYLLVRVSVSRRGRTMSSPEFLPLPALQAVMSFGPFPVLVWMAEGVMGVDTNPTVRFDDVPSEEGSQMLLDEEASRTFPLERKWYYFQTCTARGDP